MRRKKLLPVISWVISFILVFTMVLPLSVFARDNHVTQSYKESNKKTTKVSKKLMQQFSKKKYVTFLVKLKNQVDTKKVVEETKQKFKQQNLTAHKKELIERSAVVTSLRSTAMNTQSSIIEYIKSERKKGHVKNYHSYYIVNALAITATKEVLNTLSTRAEIEKILPNEKRDIIGKTPTTTSLKKIATMNRNKKTQSIEWNIDRIGAPQVWNMGIDGTGTVIANIDTGVQWDHPGLKQQYRGYNASDPNNPDHVYNWYDATVDQPVPYDDLGHGTHTMGTMVGKEPNESNQVGVAPGAKWIAVKAFSSSGGSDTDLLKAGEWIIAPKDAEGNPHPEKAPDVVNNSWGGGPGLDEWYRPMVQNWRAANIFPEFSAGNTTFSNPGGPKSVANPANYPESFATGATDSSNKLATFSLQGPSPYNELKPEISAPGVNIRSTVPGSKYEGGWNGTSMAGPHVSAVAALLRQVNASLTVEQIEDILITTATPLTDSTFPETPNNGYGHGLVNAFDAVSNLINGIGEIKGQVTKVGEDKEKPTWQHFAPKTAYETFPLILTLLAKDNVSITKIELHYRSNDSGDWKVLEPKRIAGNYQTGVYQLKLPGSDIVASKLTYFWKINDFGNNLVTTPQYNVTVYPGLSKGFIDDFDKEPEGWYSFGDKNTWECGKPSTGPKKAFKGENVFGSNLSKETYKENTDATLVMPPINVAEEGNTFLQFKQWYDLEKNYDYGNVLLSTDLETWETVTKVTGISSNWVDEEIDLSSYAGKKVYIGFNLKTDYIVNKAGWFLDHVCITDTSLKSEADNKIKPMKKKKQFITKPVHSIKTFYDVNKKKKKNQPSVLPLQATVNILESGKSVTTDPADGSYKFRHPSGTYTLRAEAYGFRSKDATVEVPEDETVIQNFTLEAIPRGTVQGKILDTSTKKPIEGATLLLIEDAVVTPIKTDKNGTFTLEAYEGTYTLRVIAPHYYNFDKTITISGKKTIKENISLKPFIGFRGELSYDDGTPENAHAFYDAGNGWAVKMSLDPQKGKKAMVKTGLFRFWDTEWPVPGGTDFKVLVYDATGPDGAPGKKLAGPFKASALRNGEWTQVDLSNHSILVSGDFYMVYIQSNPNPNAPGLASDENGKNEERSWQFVSGAWSPVPKNDGNYMIRAKVDYEVTAPTIRAPLHESYTNQDSMNIEGKTAPNINVHIQNNGNEVGSGKSKEDGSFSIPITLKKGENLITATSATEHGTTDPCTPMKIILDQENPSLSIQSPSSGWKTNRETVSIVGKATDSHLDNVKVNGQKAQLDKDGNYNLRLMLHLGENKFTVTASDKAGNTTSTELTVDANFLPLKIHNLTPNKNSSLKTGNTLKVEFTSVADLKGTFSIRIPLTNLPSSVTGNLTELPIHEDTPGHYTAYWTVPKNLKDIKGAMIEVNIYDDYGNRLRQTAIGKLDINVKK